MNFGIPHIMKRPGWSVQSVIDPAFAKLGGIVKTDGTIDRDAFCFLGVPFEGLLINDIGGKGGPDGLRAALSKLRPYSVDLDINFTESNGFIDVGDVETEYLSYDITFERTENAISEILTQGGIPVISGGSHSITEATMRAFSNHHNKNVGVVWFDGHPDFMDSYKGDRHYCGCPLRRLVESGHVKPENVAFFGLRGFANSSREIYEAREMGVTLYTMEQFHDRGITKCIEEAISIAKRGTSSFYVTFDIDAMDHTFAPATQYPGPGGFQPLEVMKFIRHLGMAGAGAMDVTEYAPLLDQTKNSGNMLATLLCEFMSGKAYAMRKR